jgi:DNA polymerase III epsilon subunit-like protein
VSQKEITMWPVGPAFGRPFGDVACPAGANCEIPYCLFSHDAVKKASVSIAQESHATSFEEGRASKRSKLDGGTTPPSLPPTISARTVQPAFTGLIARKEASSPLSKETTATKNVQAKTAVTKTYENVNLPRTATRPVSPPAKSKATTPKSDPPVPLNPRKLGKEPAIFTKRLTLLKALRTSFATLNAKVAKSSDAEVKLLKLTENQLNKLAVDEEEKIAIQHKAVYENVLKNRLVALRKMTVDDWIKERKEALEKGNEAQAKEKDEPPIKKPPPPVETGLSAEGEVEFLSRYFIADQSGLDDHGYVTKQPTEAELENTQQALAIAMGWERCERCNTRFQVFPERRAEDGALTSAGRCKHHWGRKQYPKKKKGNPLGQTKYSCCGEDIGSPGCSVHDTHVFYINDKKRLSTILPFIETPQNDKIEPHAAVCFDCEMGYTTNGLELMRLTAISWPSHQPLLDILVRPLGHILDLNTRFSGITADQYLNAKPYDPKNPTYDNKNICIVDSPYIARDLFLSHISPSTPLIGHGLENDLNAVRIIHPTIVDTVLLYPHSGGLPFRNSLKNLASTYLKWDIQQAGAAGHDSFEDAKATGELVRFKLTQEITKFKSQGWMIQGGQMLPPLPSIAPPTSESLQATLLKPMSPVMEAKIGDKRKHGLFDDESEDEQAGGQEYDIEKWI